MHRIIDSHVHLRLLYKYNPERISWLVRHCCAVISWAFGGDIRCVSDLKQYLDRHATGHIQGPASARAETAGTIEKVVVENIFHGTAARFFGIPGG